MQLTQMLLKDPEISSIFNQVLNFEFSKSLSIWNNISYLIVIGNYLRNISVTLSTCMIMQFSGEFVGVFFPPLK